MITATTIREALAAFVAGAGDGGYGSPVDEAMAATGDYTEADYLALVLALGTAAGLSDRQQDALAELLGGDVLCDALKRRGVELLDLVIPPLMAIVGLGQPGARQRDLVWLLLACHDQASDGRITAERIVEVLCWPVAL